MADRLRGLVGRQILDVDSPETALWALHVEQMTFTCHMLGFDDPAMLVDRTAPQ